MKKFYKTSLITAGILLAISIVILVICSFVGGSTLYQDIVSGNAAVMFVNHTDKNASTSAHHIDHRTIHCDFNSEYPIYSGFRTDNEAAGADSVRNINIDLGGGEFVIEKSSDNHYFQVVAESDDRYQYYTDKDTLYLIGFDGSTLNFGDRHNKLTLRIPSNIEFTDVKVSLGAGNLEWNALTTDTLTVDAGAGSLTLSDISAASTDIDLGAGTIEFDDCTLQNVSFEVGMGDVAYSGVIRGNLTAECGMGSMSFALKDSESKHNYSIDGSMGSVSVGEHEYSGMAYKKTINNDASSNYDFSCSMGDITVTFED